MHSTFLMIRPLRPLTRLLSKIRLSAFASFGFCLLAATASATSIYYVSPSGNDNWSGTLANANSSASDGPFATLSHALAVVRTARASSPGLDAAIELRGGTYYPSAVVSLGSADSGTASAPLVIENYSGENPILSGGPQGGDPGTTFQNATLATILACNSASYIRITGLTLQSASGSLLTLTGCANVEVSACTLQQSGGWAIDISGGANDLISANTITQTGMASGTPSGSRGVLAENGATGLRIESNHFSSIDHGIIFNGISGATLTKNVFDPTGQTWVDLQNSRSNNTVSLNYFVKHSTSVADPQANDLNLVSPAVGATPAEFDSVSTNATNHPPTVGVTIPDQTAVAGSAFSLSLPADTFTDPDAWDILKWTAAGMPSWLTFDVATHQFSGTPPTGSSGTSTITITATDMQGATATTSFALTVSAPAATETYALEFSQAADRSTPTALDGASLAGADYIFITPLEPTAGVSSVSFSIDGGSSTIDAAAPFDLAGGTVSTANSLDTTTLSDGSHTIQATVTLSGGQTQTVQATFTVSNTQTSADQTPIVSNTIPAQTVAAGSTFLYTVPTDTFTDPNGEILTWGASGTPGWLSFSPSTQRFSGTPTNSDAGTYSITVTVTDSSGNATSTLLPLTVTTLNQAPVVATALPNQTAYVGNSFSYTIPADTFSDPDGDTLVLSASGLPTWLSFDTATGKLTGTPPSGSPSSATLSITATDPSGASVSAPLALSVVLPPAGTWTDNLDNGLDAYYKLEQNTNDDTGRHNGTWSSTPADVGGGKLGFGYHWTGNVNCRIETGITNLLPSTGRSFSLWMYPENLQDGRAFLGWTSGLLNSLQFGISRGATSLQLEISTENGANKIDFPLQDYAQWYHVVVNIPAGASTTADIQIWVNGVKESGTQVSGSPTALSSLGVGQWEIGQAYTGASAWVGWVDEIGTWTRPLTASEIAQLYNGGKGMTRGTITPAFTWQHEDFTRSWHYDTVDNRALILQRLKELQQLHINGVPDFSSLYFTAANPTTIYVSAGHGNDYSGDGSSSNPYRTLRYVVQNVIPDTLTSPTIIYLDDSGEYTGAPYNLQYTCTATNWLAIRKNPASATRPTIKYDPQWIASELRYDETQGAQDYKYLSGKAYEPIFRLNGANQNKSNYVEISGLHIIGARNELPNNLSTECGIMTNNTGGHNCRFLDNEIEQTGHVAIKGYTTDSGDWLADGNYIHDVGHDGHDHCFYSWAPNITIRRNILMNPVGNYASLRTVNSYGGTIIFNICWGSGQQGFVIGGRNMTIAHNIVVNTAGENNQVFYMARGSCANNVVANNVVIQIDSKTATNLLLWDALGWKGSDPTGNTVETNYVQGNLTINQPNQISNTWAADSSFPKDQVVEIDGGIYYQNGNDPAISGTTAPSGTGTAIPDGQCVWVYVNSSSNKTNTVTGNISVANGSDPVATANANFTNINNLDFTLPSGSACKGTGTDIGYGTDIGPW